jgi:integrase
MAGRIPKLNWTPSLDQYTATIRGKLHRLGRDEDGAKQQFEFLVGKAEFDEPADVNPPFAEIADRWLTHVERTFSAGRFRNAKARLQEFTDFAGKGIRVRELRPNQIDLWLAPKELTDGTRRLYAAVILAALNWAASKKVRLIAANPLKGTVTLPEGESRGEGAVWPEAVYKLVLKVSNPAFADVVKILAWTGARPGTMCNVEARHYRKSLQLWDVEDMYVHRVSRKKYTKRIWLGHPGAVDLVERLNAKYPEGPIFRNSLGGPWTPETLRVYLDNLKNKFTATKDLDWPDGLVLYGLRHTFATHWLRTHPNEIEYLRVLLGHRDYKMIFKHYGHLIDQHAAINSKLSGMMVFAAS